MVSKTEYIVLYYTVLDERIYYFPSETMGLSSCIVTMISRSCLMLADIALRFTGEEVRFYCRLGHPTSGCGFPLFMDITHLLDTLAVFSPLGKFDWNLAYEYQSGCHFRNYFPYF